MKSPPRKLVSRGRSPVRRAPFRSIASCTRSSPCSIPAHLGTGSVARGAAARPTFEWNVRNFSRLQAFPADAGVTSEPFEAGGVNWSIVLNPRGHDKPEQISMVLIVRGAKKNLPVLNDTRSFVRQAWRVRACMGCAGGMAILRKLRASYMEPQDKQSCDEECVAHVLCREVRRPPLPHVRWAWANWHARVRPIRPRQPLECTRHSRFCKKRWGGRGAREGG
jgi:hypothetical protein